MTSQSEIEAEVRGYLLGALSEDARRRVEERLMTEESFLEELAVAEGELIDDYVGERLSAAEREAFERHFLSTEERRQQLSFTQALGRYANADAGRAAASAGALGAAPTPAPTVGERLRAFWAGLSWAPRAGLALACVAVIAAALWLPAGPKTPRTFVALTLAAGSGDRAGGPELPPRVGLPLGADALRLRLTLPEGTDPSAAYRAELVTSTGLAETVEVEGRDARSVTVVFPESRLRRGYYALRLHPVGDDRVESRIGDYFFGVE